MRNFRHTLVQAGGRPRRSRFRSRYSASAWIFRRVGRLGPCPGRYFSSEVSIGESLCRTSLRPVLGRADGQFGSSFPSDCMPSSRWAVLPFLHMQLSVGDQRANSTHGTDVWILAFVTFLTGHRSLVGPSCVRPMKIDVAPILMKLGSKLL